MLVTKMVPEGDGVEVLQGRWGLGDGRSWGVWGGDVGMVEVYGVVVGIKEWWILARGT